MTMVVHRYGRWGTHPTAARFYATQFLLGPGTVRRWVHAGSDNLNRATLIFHR